MIFESYGNRRRNRLRSSKRLNVKDLIRAEVSMCFRRIKSVTRLFFYDPCGDDY